MKFHTPSLPDDSALPIEERTVGSLVAERLGRSRIFQEHGIDFCCKGGQSLRVSCEKHGVSLEQILSELKAEAESPATPAFNPVALPALADHIVETHHNYLRRELPRLHKMAKRVAEVHGKYTPAVVEVLQVFEKLSVELDSHLRKEEQILFPAVAAAFSGDSTRTLDGPVAEMVAEHNDAGDALRRLRELTDGYHPPDGACNTWRALYAGLDELEADLHRHIHLENHVLFPAILAKTLDFSFTTSTPTFS